MKLYTADVKQIIFHTLSVLANTQEEASEKIQEIIKNQRSFSTSQKIEITSINGKDHTLP